MLKKIWIFFSVFFLISGSGYLIYYFTYFKPERQKKEHIYHARVIFPQVFGLYKGASFRIKGVIIGKVTNIKFENNQAVVYLALKKSYPVYKNYHIQLNPLNLFGGYYLELDPGDKNFPVYSKTLDKLVLQGKSIADPFITMGRLLSDNRKNIQLVIENLKETSEKVLEKQGTMGKVFLDDRAYQYLLSLLGQSKKFVTDMKIMKEMEHHDDMRSEWTRSVIPFGRRALQ